MHLALVANPSAGDGDAAEDLARRLAQHATRVSVHGIDDVGGAVRAAPDRIVVAGGDGSIGGVFAAAGAAGIPLAVLPVGTANDFARANGIPLDLPGAAALAGAAAARERRVHAGRVGGVVFVNVASAGLAATAARVAAPLKPALGPVAYLLGAIRAGLRSDPVLANIDVDGTQVASGEAWQLIVGATGAFGGGSGLSAADPEDPRLTVAWIPAGSRLGLVSRAWGMRSRRLEKQATVRWWQADAVVVDVSDGGRPARWNVDGEVLTLPAPVRFEHGGSCTVVVPAGGRPLRG